MSHPSRQSASLSVQIALALTWLLGVAGCGAPAEERSLVLTVRDPQLADAVRAAGARLETTTGISVALTDDGVPMAFVNEVECGGHLEARGCTYYRDREVGAAGTLISAVTGHAAAGKLEWGEPSAIIIERIADPSLLEALILHELAHAAGVSEHVDPALGGGVLAPRVSPGTLVTAADVAALCGVAPCRWYAPEAE